MSIAFSRDPYTSWIWSGGTEQGWRDSVAKGYKWENGAWAKDLNNPVNQPSPPSYPGSPAGPSNFPAGVGVGGASVSKLGGGGRTGWETTFGDPFDYADKAKNVLNMEFDRTMQRSMGMLNEDLYNRGIGNSPAAAKLAQWERQDIEGRRLAAIAGLYKDPYSKIKNEPVQGGKVSGVPYQPGPGPAYEGAYDPNLGFGGDRTKGTTFYGGRTPEEEENYQYYKNVQGFKPPPPGGGGGPSTNPETGEPIRGKNESYDAYMKRWNAWFNYNKGNSKKGSVPTGDVDVSSASWLF